VLDHSVSFLVDVKLSYPILSYLKHKSRLQVFCEYQIDACMMVFIEIYYSLCYATVTTKALFTFATSINRTATAAQNWHVHSYSALPSHSFMLNASAMLIFRPSVHPSVCLSVTLWYCVKAAKDVVEFLSSPDISLKKQDRTIVNRKSYVS